MAVMGQLGNGCKERTKEEPISSQDERAPRSEREKKFLVQSGQVLGTSSLVASSQ